MVPSTPVAPHSRQPALEVNHIAYTLGAQRILRDVSFSVSPGCGIGILGPTGSGKSTLLRIVAGLTNQTSGKISIGGQDCSVTAAHVRPCALVFQSDDHLFAHLSVWDNVAFCFRHGRGRASQSQWGRIVDELLSYFKLDAMKQRYPHELSGGQRRLVSFARSVACPPDVLLLDEATNGLDESMRDLMFKRTRELRSSRDMGLVVVSHHADDFDGFSVQTSKLVNGIIEA